MLFVMCDRPDCWEAKLSKNIYQNTVSARLLVGYAKKAFPFETYAERIAVFIPITNQRKSFTASVVGVIVTKSVKSPRSDVRRTVGALLVL